MRVFKNYASLQKALALPVKRKTAFRFLPAYGPAGFVCSHCKALVPFPLGTGSAGYGLAPDSDAMVCFACGGLQDKARMIETGKAVLYLTGQSVFGLKADGAYRVTNWPNSLSFTPRYVKTGWHNIAGKRFDSWFNGPDGFVWHGVTYGQNTQIHHCKRTKERWQSPNRRTPHD
jgi:hypothetical protein